MKIAFASDNAYPWFNGGMEKRRFLIMQEFINAGHEVHFFTMRHRGMPSSDFVKDKVHYHCTKSSNYSAKLYVDGRRNIGMALKHNTLLFFRILPYKFDFVDTEAFPFFNVISLGAYSKISASRFIVTWPEVWTKDYWKEYLGGKKGEMGYRVEVLASHYSQNTIAISSATKDSLVNILKFKPNLIRVLPCAISSEEIAQISKKMVAPKKMFVIVSRLVPQKRVAIAINAMKNVDAKLLVVGVGPEIDRLKKLAKSQGISKKIIFKERLTRDKLFTSIRSSRGLIVPSEREGLSLITLEALALGKPVFILKTTMLPREVRKYCMEVDDGKLSQLLEKALATNKFNVMANAKRHRVLDEFSSSATLPVYEKLLGTKLRRQSTDL